METRTWDSLQIHNWEALEGFVNGEDVFLFQTGSETSDNNKESDQPKH